MMGVLETDQIKIEMSSPSRAGIILPAEQAEGEDVLMLIMPVMLSN
jgi:DNA polymerase-3 subunit beta